jgi:hypothetical protein
LKLRVGINEERNEALRRFKGCGNRMLVNDKWSSVISSICTMVN